MLGRKFVPFQRVDNWYGVNSKDSSDNMLDGEWDENSINIFSDPQGGIGSRSGFTGITTASIGASTAWCGFYQYRKADKNDYYIGGAGDGKVYGFATSKYTELYSGLATGDDARYSFATLDDICVIVEGTVVPLAYTGSGSLATLSGTTITADFNIESWRYMWLHSTADPRLMYYCTTLGDPESSFTSFLNFDEDPYEVNGACKQGDDMIVSKEWSLFRVQYTGSEPKFTKRIISKIGSVSHWTMKQTPDSRLIFLAPDFQVYMLVGDTPIPVGDNIQKFLRNGVNARLKYAVAGMLNSRSQYWLSFTYASGATENDRTLVMNYDNPYRDKWGKLQYPWFVYSIPANCFAEMYVSGKAWLYHGGYLGKMYRDDTGTNDDGSAFTNTYKSKLYSLGDVTLEKKFKKLFMSYENKGDWDLDVTITCDDNAATQKNISQNMLGGAGYNSLWDVAKWDVDYWSSETDIDIGRDIDRTGKLVQLIMGTSDLDAAWNIYNYVLMAQPLKRGSVRDRES